MAIRLGSGAISGLRLGSQAVTRVYLGSAEIWAAGGGSVTFLGYSSGGDVFNATLDTTVTALTGYTGLAVCVVWITGALDPRVSTVTISGVPATIRASSEYDQTTAYLVEADLSGGDSTGAVTVVCSVGKVDEWGIAAYSVSGLVFQSSTAAGHDSGAATGLDLVMPAAGSLIGGGGSNVGTITDYTVTGATEDVDELANASRRWVAFSAPGVTSGQTVSVEFGVQFIDMAMVTGIYA